MIIAYDSKTGNVNRFVSKLSMDAVQITEDMMLKDPFVLITYTTGYGLVPQKVLKFLQNNHHNMVAVAASGNRNWGQNYCKSADIISASYKVPILLKFEMSGTQQDIKYFKERVMSIETHRTK